MRMEDSLFTQPLITPNPPCFEQEQCGGGREGGWRADRQPSQPLLSPVSLLKSIPIGEGSCVTMSPWVN